MKPRKRPSFGRSGPPALYVNAPLPPLAPHKRCDCSHCRECRDNEKWDRVFAKFELKTDDDWETKGMFQSTLRGW